MRWCCKVAWDNSLMDEGALVRCGYGHRWHCRRSKITGLLYWHVVSERIADAIAKETK